MSPPRGIRWQCTGIKYGRNQLQCQNYNRGHSWPSMPSLGHYSEYNIERCKLNKKKMFFYSRNVLGRLYELIILKILRINHINERF